MTASKVRADYEQLTRFAQVFGQQAESAQKVLSALQNSMNTLQGGDWVGEGADAFYAEMNSAILSAMQRVVAAMNEAANTTTKISRIMKQAEDDAAALFKLDGGATSTQVGVNGVPGGMDAGTVSAFESSPDGGGESGGGTSGGGTSPSGTRQKAKFANNRHDPAGLGGTATTELSPKLQKMVAKLHPQVKAWITASPASKMQLEKLANDGFQFDPGSELLGKPKRIAIFARDPKTQFQEVVGAAAIRVYKTPSAPTATPDNHEEYMTAYDKYFVALEGALMFNQIAVWEDNPEGLLHRPQDPSGIPMTPAEFAEGRRIYGQWIVGAISTEEAITQLGTFHGQQILPATHSDHAKFRNYRELWLNMGREQWDRDMGMDGI